jgi:hypothetical protein
MRYNKVKSENPLCGKGLLFSERSVEEEFNEAARMHYCSVNMKERNSWYFPPPLDQGTSSMGVGYAWATYFGCGGVTQDLEMLPTEFALSMYLESQVEDEWEGVEPLYHGTCPITTAKLLRDKNFFSRLVWTDDADDLSARVVNEGPAIVCAPWFAEMTNTDPNGFIRPNGRYEGPHCWVVYGADEMWETFFAINTWGTGYGKDGKFLIKFSDMAKLLKDGYAIATE